ncbi:MAG: pyridoxal phosphate-dependent aminotransferase family protein [Deltaproteobacteria bacterium]
MSLPARQRPRFVDEALAELQAAGHLRDVRAVRPDGPVAFVVDGRRVLSFASNDYLGLSSHPAIREAAAAAVLEHGLGPRASALICGHTTEHEALEAELAAFVAQPAAMLTPTGYAANLAVLDAFAGEDLHVFSDALNHASIVDGCARAKRRGARVEIYRHADVEDLERRLLASDRARLLVVTETVFSMDGDVAPLAAIAALKARRDFTLVTDEGHATLLFGARGAGIAEAQGVAVDVHVGTASKAFGAVGGFVAADEATVRLLRNRGRAYVFSTAMPLPIVAAIRAALRLDRTELRARLGANVARLAVHLDRELVGPIVPVIIGAPDATIRERERLFEAGVLVAGVRPPTVPEGTSRLRVTLSAAHSSEDVDRLAVLLGDR